MRDFLIGADPELFVRDVTTGTFVSGHDLIPGTKEHPFGIPDGAVQVDGVACEFNIDPCTSLTEFHSRLDSVMFQMQSMVSGVNENYILEAIPTAVFDPTYFKSLPRFAKELGCQPDFNAYTMDMNTPPFTRKPFRTGSFHVHIGWGEFLDIYNEEHFKECGEATRQLDAALYASSLLWDSDTRRRELYGKIGAFRPKPYGVEYRPMSNAALKSPEITQHIYETSMLAMDMLFNQGIRLMDDPILGEFCNDVHKGFTPTKDDIKKVSRRLKHGYGFNEVVI